MFNSQSHERWQTAGYSGSKRGGKGLVLTRARLGEFIYQLLKAGGGVENTYAMRSEFDRCYCQFVVYLPKSTREAFEAASGFDLEPLSELKPA